MILVIEDDAVLAKLICDELISNNFESTSTDNLINAVEIINDSKPELIIVDYKIGENNTLEWIKELTQQNFFFPPFIVSTGCGDEKIATEYMKLGARDYMVKDIFFFEKLPKVVVKIIAELETENKMRITEKALHESERMYSALLENLPGFVYRCKNDKDWTISYISSGCHSVTGYKQDDFINNKRISFGAIIHPAWQDLLWVKWQICLSEKTSLEEEYIIIDANGDEKWVWERGRGVFDDENNLMFLEGFISDITDRKKAEFKLRQSETKYRRIFENVQDIIYQTDLSGKIIEISPSVEKYGYSRDELIGKPVEIVYADPGERIKLLELIKTNGKVLDYELKLKTKDGEIYTTSVTSHIILDDKLNLTGIEGSLRDITKRKKDEELLRENENILRTLIENVGFGVMIIDPVNRTIDNINEYGEKIIGVSKKEIVGKDCSLFIFENESRIISYQNNNFDKDNFEGILTDVSGNKIPIISTINKINISGKDKILESFIDISERKKIEQLITEKEQVLRTLINSTPDIICFKDGKGRWLQANDADLELFSLTHVDYFGKTDSELSVFAADIYKEAFLACEESDENAWKNKKMFRVEETIPTINGEFKVYDVIKVPIFNDKNERKGLVVLGRDITDRKKVEQLLVDAKEKAEKANSAKNIFLANMSHELRTPLVGILGYSELMIELLKDNEMIEMAAGINRTGKRLLKTLSLVLDLSKIESDKSEPVLNEQNILEILGEICDNYKSLAKTKNIEILFNPHCQSFHLNTDAEMFRVIFDNLLNNAVKFTNQGKIIIDSLEAAENNKNYLEIGVTDTGIGINNEDIPLIFEEFKQLSEGTTKEFPGTGLGLSITKKMVEKLNGTIEVKSLKNKGSKFLIRFPHIKILNKP